jgi:hypothetical protein
MFLSDDEVAVARTGLTARANWAAARGFFWLSERDARLLERLSVSAALPPRDALHLAAALMRIGGAENEALARRINDRLTRG